MNDANPQYDRQNCYFCHEQDAHILETHHVVPQRFGGSDDAENLVRVCPTCHERLERLYDGRFYDALGIETEDSDKSDDTNTIGATLPEEVKPLKRVIEEIESNHAEGAPHEEYVEEAKTRGYAESDILDGLELMKQQGEVYEPRNDRYRAT